MFRSSCGEARCVEVLTNECHFIPFYCNAGHDACTLGQTRVSEYNSGMAWTADTRALNALNTMD